MSWLGNIVVGLMYVVTGPGIPFAMLISKFKQTGDGTDNESQYIKFYLWAAVFGIVVWVFVIIGAIWAWNNLSISLSVK